MNRRISLMLCSLSLTVTMWGQTPTARVQTPAEHLPDYDQSVLPAAAVAKIDRSDMAASVVADSEHARTALRNGDRPGAEQNVKEALILIDKLKMPGPQETAEQKVVPIYSEWEKVSIVQPSEAKGASSSTAASTGTAQQDVRKTAGSSDRSERVSDTAPKYTSVSLDLQAAQGHLQNVQSALKARDIVEADAALKAVKDDVSMTTVQADVPLLRARQKFGLADNLVTAGRYQEAAAALRDAAAALQEYASAHSDKSAQVQTMSKEITARAFALDQNLAGLDSKIHEWWNTAADWTGR
jgi:hypothetical protein